VAKDQHGSNGLVWKPNSWTGRTRAEMLAMDADRKADVEQGDGRQCTGKGSTEIDITSRRAIILSFIPQTVNHKTVRHEKPYPTIVKPNLTEE
jgi:hypothetical protein